MVMNAIGRLDEVKNNEKPVVNPVSQVKNKDDELKRYSAFAPYNLAFMPTGGIGSLLNGSKQSDVGAFQA